MRHPGTVGILPAVRKKPMILKLHFPEEFDIISLNGRYFACETRISMFPFFSMRVYYAKKIENESS